MPETGIKIATLYAWVAADQHGNEGICTMSPPGAAAHILMIGSDRDAIASLRPYAEEVRAETGATVRLKMYIAGVAIETLP